jgi:hypothetical protein
VVTSTTICDPDVGTILEEKLIDRRDKLYVIGGKQVSFNRIRRISINRLSQAGRRQTKRLLNGRVKLPIGRTQVLMNIKAAISRVIRKIANSADNIFVRK